jgi:DNA-directed RNA polymerase subunit H (RpoH/RPB5)
MDTLLEENHPSGVDIVPMRVYKSPDEIRTTVLKTLLECFEARKILAGTAEESLSQVLKSGTEDGVYHIFLLTEPLRGNETTTKEVLKKTKGYICYVKMVADTSSPSSASSLTNFMNQYEGKKRVVVIPEFSKKMYDSVMAYGHVEVFFETELMTNILKDPLQPTYEILSKAEALQVRTEYVLQLIKFSQLYEHDPVAIFLGLTQGTIVRVITANEGSGYVANYRVVLRVNASRV